MSTVPVRGRTIGKKEWKNEGERRKEYIGGLKGLRCKPKDEKG
jgi:hypothetical protein